MPTISVTTTSTRRPSLDSDPSSWLFAGTGLSAGGAIPDVLRNDFQAPAVGPQPDERSDPVPLAGPGREARRGLC